jgi:hypothetical protein
MNARVNPSANGGRSPPPADKPKNALGTTARAQSKDEGHHPHGLQDPTPLVDFILRHTRGFHPRSR